MKQPNYFIDVCYLDYQMKSWLVSMTLGEHGLRMHCRTKPTRKKLLKLRKLLVIKNRG